MSDMIDYEAQVQELLPQTREVLSFMKYRHYDNPQKTLHRGREGWITRNVNNPETIWEHMHKVILATYHRFGDDSEIIKAVSHEFPENEEPDYLPGEVKLETKYDLEHSAMIKIASELPQGRIYLQGWLDFEAQQGTTKTVFHIDKICPAIQALNYLRDGNGDVERLNEFYPWVKTKVNDPALIKIVDEMYHKPIHKEDAYIDYFAALEKLK